MAFAGFTKRKHSTINNGDWDRDGVINRRDCEPLNFRKQGPEHDSRAEKSRAYFKRIEEDKEFAKKARTAMTKNLNRAKKKLELQEEFD